MGFFDEDPFEDIVREFFQENRSRTSSSRNSVKSEKEERIIDYIEEDKNVYFVFEIYGYSKDDLKVEVGRDFVEVKANIKDTEGIQDYLIPKLKKGVVLKKEVPGLKIKKYDWTFNNGILEVRIETK
ncbi:MAG: Hsp20/alpha crystallin family protein [Nanoarchaeota archaeon]|nr:Hsp20/alpha crystallin family protein [Nanoarchaeota archaeon]